MKLLVVASIENDELFGAVKDELQKLADEEGVSSRVTELETKSPYLLPGYIVAHIAAHDAIKEIISDDSGNVPDVAYVKLSGARVDGVLNDTVALSHMSVPVLVVGDNATNRIEDGARDFASKVAEYLRRVARIKEGETLKGIAHEVFIADDDGDGGSDD